MTRSGHLCGPITDARQREADPYGLITCPSGSTEQRSRRANGGRPFMETAIWAFLMGALTGLILWGCSKFAISAARGVERRTALGLLSGIAIGAGIVLFVQDFLMPFGTLGTAFVLAVIGSAKATKSIMGRRSSFMNPPRGESRSSIRNMTALTIAAVMTAGRRVRSGSSLLA
jgi:hypothetical protein